MRIYLFALIAALSLPVTAATDTAAKSEDFFERNLKQVGQKLDKAKSKGKEVSKELKDEAKEVYYEARKETLEAKEKVTSESSDWTTRVQSAFQELKEGVKGAWGKLKGTE